MKVISWNCNRAFRKKYKCVAKFDADILIIPESESPQRLQQCKFKIPSNEHLWVGDRDAQGLSVFTFNGYHARVAEFYNKHFKYILPLEISNGRETFLLLALWTKAGKTHSNGYVVQAVKALKAYRRYIDEKTIIIGDFNSNKSWDSHFRRDFNHSSMLKLLNRLHFSSVYHVQTGQEQGAETTPTIYMFRNPERAYHIDYAFVHEQLMNKVEHFSVGQSAEWLNNSDHMPLFLNLSL